MRLPAHFSKSNILNKTIRFKGRVMSEAVTHWNGNDRAQRSHASTKRVLVNILALDVSVGSFYLWTVFSPSASFIMTAQILLNNETHKHSPKNV